MSHCILILEDDADIGDALLMGLEREDRTVILCRDVESAQLTLEHTPVTHIVSDIRLTGPFRFEGLDFIDHVKKHSRSAQVILMTGSPTAELQAEAEHRGAVAFLAKPFSLESLETIINQNGASANLPAVCMRVPTIDEIIGHPELFPQFQPIVNLADRKPIGFESLARFRTECVLRRPDVLFEYAYRKSRIPELELACVAQSLERGRELAQRGLLFLNLHPVVFQEPECLVEGIVAAATNNLVSLERVVLEITEQQSLGAREPVLHAVRALEKHGARFAFDDLGVAYSHLTLIADIRPSFLKISQHFGTGFEGDVTKQKIVRNVLSLAKDFSCQLVLEGIEHEATARFAHDLGIPLGQGYLFGRPAEAAEFC